MPINLDKPHLWKADIVRSVDAYNTWFLDFAPQTYRTTRLKTTQVVETVLNDTDYLTKINPAALKRQPAILETLRMCTAPPLARDRLVGLASVPRGLVDAMEKENRLPRSIANNDAPIERISLILLRLLDRDLFPWLDRNDLPKPDESYRAAAIVADRLCGSQSDPIVRNAQEQRQLNVIRAWLLQHSYLEVRPNNFREMPAGTFAFRLNVPIQQETGRSVNLPIDALIMPRTAQTGDLPIMVEAKSAGDFANTNKRRKEEAVKMSQLKHTYGMSLRFVLFLCGYFDSGYLGYEAAEGIDWVWEHRIEDLLQFGV
jgi:XamI restriction endonuclease